MRLDRQNVKTSKFRLKHTDIYPRVLVAINKGIMFTTESVDLPGVYCLTYAELNKLCEVE